MNNKQMGNIVADMFAAQIEKMPPMPPQFNEPPPLDAGMQAQLPAFTSMPQEMPVPDYTEDPSGASSLRNPIMPVPNAY